MFRFYENQRFSTLGNLFLRHPHTEGAVEFSELIWLKEHLHGLNEKAKSLKGLRQKMEKYYPKPRESSTSFSEVLNIISNNDNRITADELSKLLKRGKTVIYEYLKKLESWDILDSEYEGSRKVWSLKNKNLPAPER